MRTWDGGQGRAAADDATSFAINVALTLPLPINVPLIIEVFSTEFRITKQATVEH